jgi:hypothetical protein
MEPSHPEVKASPTAEGTDTQQSEAQPAPTGPAERLREARARHRRAVRQVLLIAVCLVALLCLGGVAAGFLYYHQATKPDLSSPVLVTHSYLSAYLIDRDDRGAQEYQCSDDSGLSEIRALRDDIDNRQRKYGVAYTFSVEGVNEVERQGDQARLRVDLVLATVSQGQPLREVEHWDFTARNQDGWHVCGAHEVT